MSEETKGVAVNEEPPYTPNRLDRDLAAAATHADKLTVALSAARRALTDGIETFLRSDIVDLVMFGGKVVVKITAAKPLTPSEWGAMCAALAAMKGACAVPEPALARPNATKQEETRD